MIFPKKALTFLCLLSVMLSFFPGTADAKFESTTEEALALLEEVLLIDLSKYNVTLRSHSFDEVGPPFLPEFEINELIHYKLKSKDSNLTAIVNFKNETFSGCKIYATDGSPLYLKQQASNNIACVKDVLERFQDVIGVTGFNAMYDLLSEVDQLESTVKKLGNMKLEITHQENTTTFEWFYMSSGVAAKAFSIRIQNGDVRYLTNYLCLSTVGSADVKISEDQAINLAREYLASFSWKATDGSGNQVAVKDFNVLDSPVNAALSMQPRESMELYPYWYIELCLDKVYPGSVSSIHVGLWADTGTVVYCQPISAGVAYPTETETNNSTIDTSIVVAIFVALIAVIVVAAFFVKKRRK